MLHAILGLPHASAIQFESFRTNSEHKYVFDRILQMLHALLGFLHASAKQFKSFRINSEHKDIFD